MELSMYLAAPICEIVFLTASPVDAESRQFVTVLAPLILLIACSFQRLDLARMRIAAVAAPAILVAAGITRCAMAFPHFPPDRLRPLVAYVDTNPQWDRASILLPPDCEGPAIAEFAEHAPHRPLHTLLRPSKVMGISGWEGIRQSRYKSAAGFEANLGKNPINLIIVDAMQTLHTPVDSVIRGAIKKFPDDWRRIAVIRSRCRHQICGLWDIYASQETAKATISPVFRQRTLNRFESWHKAAK